MINKFFQIAESKHLTPALWRVHSPPKTGSPQVNREMNPKLESLQVETPHVLVEMVLEKIEKLEVVGIVIFFFAILVFDKKDFYIKGHF